jgi:hypothetical protein
MVTTCPKSGSNFDVFTGIIYADTAEISEPAVNHPNSHLPHHPNRSSSLRGIFTMSICRRPDRQRHVELLELTFSPANDHRVAFPMSSKASSPPGVTTTQALAASRARVASRHSRSLLVAQFASGACPTGRSFLVYGGSRSLPSQLRDRAGARCSLLPFPSASAARLPQLCDSTQWRPQAPRHSRTGTPRQSTVRRPSVIARAINHGSFSCTETEQFLITLSLDAFGV